MSGKAAQTFSPQRLEYVNEFKKIDKTGKGRITVEEATAHYNERFRELDRNGDGFLDLGELEPLMPLMNAQSTRELLRKLDRNGDGKVSPAEFLIIVNWLFQLASSQRELALGDVEHNAPVLVPAPVQKDPADTAPGAKR
jgi:Ca2+-binding EF-hand superfamily protein